MFSSKGFLLGAVVISLVGCSSSDTKEINAAEVLPGTATAVVGLYLDKNGYPQPTVETVVVAPGQRIVFTGPDQFEILFKDSKSPVDSLVLSTTTGVLTLYIPIDVFMQEEKDDPSSRGKDEISYKYGIRVDGKVTDPEIKVRPR